MFLLPASVEAYSFFGDACSQPGAKDSPACSGTGVAGSNPIVETLNKVTALISILSGIAAVILLIIAGFMFVTANGESGKVEEAKKTVIYTVVGLFVVILARAIIGFVISRM